MGFGLGLPRLLLFALQSTIDVGNTSAYCHFQLGWLRVFAAQRAAGAQGAQGYIRQPSVALGVCIALTRILLGILGSARV